MKKFKGSRKKKRSSKGWRKNGRWKNSWSGRRKTLNTKESSNTRLRAEHGREVEALKKKRDPRSVTPRKKKIQGFLMMRLNIINRELYHKHH